MITIGGIIFWAIIAAWILISIIMVEDRDYDTNGRANTLTTVILIIALYLLTGTNIKHWTFNWSYIILGTIAYFIIGFGWSILKWTFFVKYKLAYQKQWNHKLEKPDISQYDGRIIAWIAWWPFSIVRYLLRDLLVDVADYIMKTLGSIYSSITNKIYGD